MSQQSEALAFFKQLPSILKIQIFDAHKPEEGNKKIAKWRSSWDLEDQEVSLRELLIGWLERKIKNPCLTLHKHLTDWSGGALFYCAVIPTWIWSLWKCHQNKTFLASSPRNSVSEVFKETSKQVWYSFEASLIKLKWNFWPQWDVPWPQRYLCRQKCPEFHESDTTI